MTRNHVRLGGMWLGWMDILGMWGFGDGYKWKVTRVKRDGWI
jgi:hypothetical protein